MWGLACRATIAYHRTTRICDDRKIFMISGAYCSLFQSEAAPRIRPFE